MIPQPPIPPSESYSTTSPFFADLLALSLNLLGRGEEDGQVAAEDEEVDTGPTHEELVNSFKVSSLTA